MDYSETLEYLFSQLPIYQRTGPAAYKPDLSNTHAILNEVGNPHKEFKSVHIAGTNGKGSVAHMMASVLQEQGFKTGLYTSPHLKDFRERILIDGEMITHDSVVELVENHRSAWSHLSPSFFEITVAMAFWYFAKEQVDIAVIETGLGGRLDSTNVITPELSVITNIGFDHVNLLGNTIEKIACEKGGIIKEDIPIVLGEMNFKAKMVLEKMADEKKAPLVLASDDIDNLPLSDLSGDYQKENRATAYKALQTLKNVGWKIDYDNVLKGFANVKTNTKLRGRWQRLGTNPLIIADCAHNVEGLKVVMDQVENEEYQKLHFVLGMVNDKDLDKVLDILPRHASYYFCKADIPRGLAAKELQTEARTKELRGECYSSVSKAFEAARIYASPNDFIYVGGSVFTVAEIL